MSQIKHILFFTSIVVNQIIAIFRCDFFYNSVLPETKVNCDENKEIWNTNRPYTSIFMSLRSLKYNSKSCNFTSSLS
jgi:hypothetical protein